MIGQDEHWTRQTDADMQETWEALRCKWPEGTVRSWLRYADRRIRRGLIPWLPSWAKPQVRKVVSECRLPGREGLAGLTGLTVRRCELLLEHPELWRDPYPCTDEERCAADVRAASGVRAADVRPAVSERSVAPTPASGVRAADVRAASGVRAASRASISTRVQQEQEQVQDHDPLEEGPGALEPEQPQTPTAEPAGPAFTLVPPNSAPPAKKKPKATPPPKAPEPPPPEDWSEDEIALANLHEAIWREAMDVPRHKLKRFKNWADDRRWFRDTIIAEFEEDVSIRDELLKMQLWVRREIEAAISGRGHRVPRDHAQFMLNWFTRARSNPRHTDRDRDAAYRGVPDGYKPMRMDSNVNYGPRQHHELSEAERAELDRLPF